MKDQECPRCETLASQNRTLRIAFSANDEDNKELMETVAELEDKIEDCRDLLKSILDGDGTATMKRIESVKRRLD